MLLIPALPVWCRLPENGAVSAISINNGFGRITTMKIALKTKRFKTTQKYVENRTEGNRCENDTSESCSDR